MMYLEIDREVGDRLGDGDFAGLRCGLRVICKCPTQPHIKHQILEESSSGAHLAKEEGEEMA